MIRSKVTKTVGLTTMMVMAMMMMMMVAEVAPKPADQSKHSAKTKSSSAANKTVEMVPLHLDWDTLGREETIRPLQNISISPWTNKESTDPSLALPFSEARCRLRGCLDSEGLEDLSLESRPIMRQVLRLRRVSSKDGYHLRLETPLVAVGCTCVRPVVLRQD